MDNGTCLFLGAGASIPFGYPATREFMNDLPQSITDDILFNEIVPILGDIKNLDIETVLTKIDEIDNHINKDLKKETFVSKYLFQPDKRVITKENGKEVNETIERYYTRKSIQISNLKKHVYEHIYDTYKEAPYLKSKDLEHPVKTYFKLFQTIAGSNTSIFTTNYDLCVESSFWDYGQDDYAKDLSTGFENKLNSLQFTGIYDENCSFHLFKLHGSVDWKRDPQNHSVIIRYKQPKVYDLNEHPLLFPGEKFIKTFPFDVLHSEFKKRLLTKNSCIVIGFSFRDEYLNEVFEDVMKINKELKIIIWNPNDVNPGFEKKRVLHFPEKFELKTIDKFLNFITKGELMKMQKLAAATAIPGSNRINRT